jgi:phosphoribosyl-ATP pyrophosphohydrolase/phosphoribosyl-AMP cyclohydrolase
MNKINFEKDGGLVPAIIQHAITKKVLMLGYMNKAAYEKTMADGLVCFYSRSKQRLWIKGETSGNFLYLKQIHKDCDNDALLVEVLPSGPVCHTGSESCFENEADSDNALFLFKLQSIIQERALGNDPASYTYKLLQSGIDRIAQKLGEEAVETVIAAKNSDEELLKGEIADLLYHLLVLMHHHLISLEDVATVLALRHQKK